MKEKQTEKVLDVWDRGIHVTAIKDYRDQQTPYHIYANWYDNGHHRKLIHKTNHIVSAINLVSSFYTYALANK